MLFVNLKLGNCAATFVKLRSHELEVFAILEVRLLLQDHLAIKQQYFCCFNSASGTQITHHLRAGTGTSFDTISVYST